MAQPCRRRLRFEWTDATWNPVTGCTKITRGCDFCYAERFSERFRGVPGHPFEHGFDLTLRPDRLNQPLTWRRPRRIFVNSMSDLFHKEIPKHFVDAVFDTMEAADWHTFQILTKRSSLMARYLRGRYGSDLAPAQIWLGVSVEDRQNAVRIKHLRATQAAVRFVSFEPLLGRIGEVELTGYRLGDRRRRERPQGEADGGSLGGRVARSMRVLWRGLLLQAMGRHPAEVWRQAAGRARVEPMAPD
jgi:protein gp37